MQHIAVLYPSHYSVSRHKRFCKRSSVNLFPSANPLEEGGIRLFCFGEWSAVIQTVSISILANIKCYSESEWVCHSPTHPDCYLVIHTVRVWVGEACCHGCECMFVCVPTCRTHRIPNGSLDTIVTCVSRQNSVELASYFELFYPHLNSLSSRLPCSHFPCLPTWTWGFTALIAKVVVSVRASTVQQDFSAKRGICCI